MTAFPPCEDEDARLCALQDYEILDSRPEPAFERITALAARLLGVPIVLVSLVDADRQWFKSAHGIELREMRREISFCTHAILSDELFIVPDATRDPRFAANPLVTGPFGLRFYAGAPLRTPDGRHRLGTLCVIDRRPRTLTAAEEETLRDLAAVVVDALEHRRETRQRERAETELARTQTRSYRHLIELASDLFLVHDFEGRLQDVNQAACDLSGYTRAEMLATPLERMIVGFDAVRLRGHWEGLAPGQGLTLMAEHRRKDGSTFPVEARLSVFQDTEAAAGTDSRRVFALVRDVTERKREEDLLRESHERLEQRVLERTVALGHANAELRQALEENDRLATAVDSVSLGIVLLDARAEGCPIIFANPGFSVLTGYGRDEAIGRECHLLHGPGTDPKVAAALHAAIQAGESFRCTMLNYRKDGSSFWNELTISPVVDGGAGDERHFLGVLMDVTTQHETMERLRLLESAVVNAHDGILITRAEPVDEPGPKIFYANPAFERMSGYCEEEIIGKTPRMFQGAGTAPEARANIRRALKRWKPVRQEILNYRKDGTEFWVELDIVPVANEQGWFTHWVSVQRDVTERKAAERAVRDSEVRYRQLFDTNPLPTWVYERETLRFLEVNPAAVAHYGYRREELLGMSLYDLVAPEEIPALRAAVEGEPHGPVKIQSAWRHRKKDGEEIAVEVAAHNFTFAGREARLVVVHDVTEERRTAQALRASEGRFERITANVPGMVFRFLLRTDGSSHFPFVSEGSREIYGLEPEEIQADAQTITMLVPPEGRDAFAKSILESAITLRPWRWEGLVQSDKPGFPKHLQATSRPERMENGDTIWDGVVVDVTERRRNEDLERAKEAAERANAAKSEFLSRMSHELRTPLNAILGFGQLLEIDDLTTLQAQSVEHILKGGRHLLGLIDEVLDIARIESGHLGFSLEPVEVRAMLRETLGLVRHMTYGQDIRLLGIATNEEDDQDPDADNDDGGGVSVQADLGRLKQVLVNLLSNAIKYNRPGGEVELGCVESPSTPGHLRVTVRDTGGGITPAQIAKLFTPFERLDAAHGPIEGVGLGLAVSKRLVEAMGGTLGVQSTPGMGSTFWVDLPRAGNPDLDGLLAPTGTAGTAPVPHMGRRLLYIEDNPSNLQLVQGIFDRRRPDWQILAATDGTRGLELARAGSLDLILLDLQLPGLSGEAVLAQLRADPRTRHFPVILLSADANPQSYARLLAAGAHAYLTKPLDVREFLAAVDEALTSSPAEFGGYGPSVPKR